MTSTPSSTSSTTASWRRSARTTSSSTDPRSRRVQRGMLLRRLQGAGAVCVCQKEETSKVMKRNLCLSAIALACAGGAYAQSSVTMWGIVDTNVQHFHADGVGSENAMGTGSLSTSQLGFRGIEDLGGGLR